MSKGFLVFAEDAQVKKYTRCAYALGLSLKKHMPDANISLVTNNTVPDKYVTLFDNVIEIPWYDKNKGNTHFRVEDRWKLYHASPYDETILLDADMLVLSNLDHYWEYLNKYDLFFTNNVLDYRGKVITNRYYRKTFDANNLPNYYFGLCYFKKSELAKEFFKWVEDITNNWQLFYGKFVNNNYPKAPSMDVTVSLATKIMDCEKYTSHNFSPVTFTHMKPMIQGWESATDSWQDSISHYFNDRCDLKIGNYQQYGVFHYTEYSFLNTSMLNQLERMVGIN